MTYDELIKEDVKHLVARVLALQELLEEEQARNLDRLKEDAYREGNASSLPVNTMRANKCIPIEKGAVIPIRR